MDQGRGLQGHLLARGGIAGNFAGQDVVARFRDPAAEVRALRRAAALCVPPDAAKLALRGSDRAKFLHGQCTQEIKAKKPGEGGYAFLLDPKGKVLSDLRFFVTDEAIWLSAPLAVRDAFRARLERYVLISDVTIEDVTERFTLLLLAGPRARQVLAAAGAAWPEGAEDSAVATRIEGAEVFAVSDATTGETGCLLWVPVPDAVRVHEALLAGGAALGIERAGLEALDIARIEAGRPWFGVDLDEQVLPAESGQLERSVSFSKGCYTGQEVVARQHWLGKPRRTLVGLTMEGAPPARGAAVARDGQAIGAVTSACRSPTLDATIGLALVRGTSVEPGARVEVAGEGARPIDAEVAALPFVRGSAAGAPPPTS